jgi:hypothetical protein
MAQSYEYRLRTTPSHLLSSQERKDQKLIYQKDKLDEQIRRLERKDKTRARVEAAKNTPRTKAKPNTSAPKPPPARKTSTSNIPASARPPAQKKSTPSKPAGKTSRLGRFRGRGGGVGGGFPENIK